MKICKKCNHKNKEDAEYCSQCGAKLKDNNKKWIIPTMIIIVIVLLILIFFLLGKNKGTHHLSSSNSSVKSEIISSKESKSSSYSVASKSSKDNTSNLDRNNLTPKQTAAAIAYWINESQISTGVNPWEQVSDANRKPTIILSSIPDTLKLSNKGMGMEYTFSEEDGLNYGGSLFYVLSDGGNDVNVYFVSAGMDPNAEITPKITGSLDDIVKKVNQNHAAEMVREAADNIEIKQQE